jgi:hypothetical protein
MAGAGVGDPQRMMVAGEHGLEPDRRLANLLPIEPRPPVDGFMIDGYRGHRTGDFRKIVLARGPRLNFHRQSFFFTSTI